jgi:hypothetical protein
MTTPGSNNPGGAAAPPEPDPLARLYRMSRTAGLASSDYTAVNAPSVVALLLGVLSVLANFEAILLVIPLAAIVVGTIAVYQIRTSNGTQTGLPLAGIGVALALGFGIWASTAQAREAARTRADRELLISMTSRLGELIRDEKYDQAYNELFSTVFRERVPFDAFQQIFVNYQRTLGKVKSTSSNGLFNFETDPASGLRIAVGQVLFNYERGTPAERPQIIFGHRDGRWAIENIPQFFAPPGTGPGGGM